MHKKHQHSPFLLSLCGLLVASNSYGSMTIDGVIDEPEWQNALVYSDFVSVEPLTGEPAKYNTEVRMITNDEGIFVAFTNYQPPSVKRVKRQFARDAQIEADRNIVSIDFDGTALAGYDFTVGSANSMQDGIVTPGSYSGDWDGTWYSQTSSEADYWYSEMHIPWTVAPMSKSKDGRKKMAVWFSRVVYNESLRFAFPNAYYSRTTFMEDWQPIEVDQVEASTLDWFPYVSYSRDLQDDTQANETNAGLDFIWRPNSSTQLTGAINPDFGQVESDDLVVNFSAFETFVTEKRPFFTENQALFSSALPNEDAVLYTRRIGAGPAGSSGGLVDIDLALKVTHFGDDTDVGLFAVSEEDSAGSFGGDFISSRVQRKVGGLSVGHRLTHVDRTALNRQATVQVADMIWQKSAVMQLRGQILYADIQQQANAANNEVTMYQRDFAGWASWSYAPSDEWYHYASLSSYGDDFDMNDLGYMKRNGFTEFRGTSRHDRLQYVPQSRFLSSSTELAYGYKKNIEGNRLSLWTELDHTWTFRSTRALSVEALLKAPGHDDRITRGNGLLAIPARYALETRYLSPRGNTFTYDTKLEAKYDSLQKLSINLRFRPQLYLSDTITLGGELSYRNMQEWLIWDFDTQQLAGFDSERINADLRFDWYPSSRQEVRLKFQWVGIDAQQAESYLLDNGGRLQASNNAASDFSISDTALQIRYRYQLAPLSNIFLVYSRGGYFASDEGNEGAKTLLQQGWDGVQVESIIAKIRYRF